MIVAWFSAVVSPTKKMIKFISGYTVQVKVKLVGLSQMLFHIYILFTLFFINIYPSQENSCPFRVHVDEWNWSSDHMVKGQGHDVSHHLLPTLLNIY